MKMYEGHSGEMQGVNSYGDHCKSGKKAWVPGSLENSVINGMTYLLQDYIRRGICEVNVDEWDDRILVQVIVYDDIVEQKRYKTVREMFPSTALKATRDNKTWEELSKPINVLVELGSKDSIEYKNSEEYKKEQANKTENRQMTNQLMLSQVRLVYEYLCDEVTRCKNGSAPISLLSHQHVLETARNGLFMIIRATLGEGYDEEEKKTYQEGVPLAAMPKKAAEEDENAFASEDKNGDEKIDLEDIVETAVDIQRKEVFSFAKHHPEVREDYRKTNDWYGGDTIARSTAIVRFDPPSGNYMEFKKKLFEAFGLFYRQYASPAYDICAQVIVSEDGSIGVMLHAVFNMDFKISDEDLAVVKDCGMAHRYYREDSDVPFEHEGCLAEPDEPAAVEEAPMYEPRYSGDAMIKDDIVRHSVYDLSDAKFSIGPVDFVGYRNDTNQYEDRVPIWRARAVFTVGDDDVQFWFKFDERGSAIDNSVKAFDRMVHDGILHACFDYKPVPADTGACKGVEN